MQRDFNPQRTPIAFVNAQMGPNVFGKERTSMDGTENRNARRSIRLLKEAFLHLLAEKPYDQITVSDVTRAADLNRGTFYAHFNNIDDLLRSAMDDLSEKVSLLMDQSLGADFLDDPMPVLSHIGTYLSADRDLYQRIVSSTSVEPFITSLHEMFCDAIRTHIGRAAGTKSQLGPVLTEYLASGVLGTYRNWLAGEYGDLSVADLNEMLCALVKATGRTAAA